MDIITSPSRKRGLDEPLDEATLKKPRLHDENPPTVIGAIASALSGVFSFASPQKEPLSETSHVNEQRPAVADVVPKPRPAIKLAALRGTKWDAGGPPKKTGRPKKAAEKGGGTRGRRKKTESLVSSGSQDKGTESQVEDKTESQEKATGKMGGREEEKPGGQEKEKPKRGRGRKTKAASCTTLEPKSKAESEAKEPAKGRRGRGRKKAEPPPIVESDGDALEQSPSRRLAWTTADELSSTELHGASPIKHLTFDLNMRLAASTGKSMPKSILSPTKKKTESKKSVTFNKNNEEVFFEDLPKTSVAKKAKPGRKPKPVVVEPEEDEDEIRCAICALLESKPPNEIILCDNCDFAAHQACYDVPEIPEGDWLCKSCTQEDVLNTPKKAGECAEAAVEEVPDIPNLERHLRGLQRVLLDRCAGRRRIRMIGQEEAYEKAQQLVEQTVNAGEGNSMLLIGPRGCGKTTMVENIVGEFSRQHGRDFYVVRLNGFIHTDDKLALKEIWRQLGKEMKVEDDLINRSNYADTMASLLALLSHPSEIMGTDEGYTSQSVVFIIDEFDMFAAHPRQTLLYNLLDIAQSRKAPIAVLGCTTRLDVVEMLEKRVKSRFSHRYAYLSTPRNLAAYWQVCRQGLMLGDAEAREEGLDVDLDGYYEFQRYWNHSVEELYKQREFQDVLQHHFYTTKSPSAFFNEWILPLSGLSASKPLLSMPSGAHSLSPPDSRTQLLSTLSDLELGLLIAAARLDIVADTDTVNLAMAYDEYASLVGRQRAQSATSGLLAVGAGRVWSRGVAGMAWERLSSLGLLVPSAGARGMWKLDVCLEEIPAAAKLNSVLARWCREI